MGLDYSVDENKWAKAEVQRKRKREKKAGLEAGIGNGCGENKRHWLGATFCKT
jgi:hypothetical protein